MRGTQVIESQIQQILNDVEFLNPNDKKDKAERSRLKKRLKFLLECKHYLETNPTEEFLRKEDQRLQKRITLIEDGYKQFSTLGKAAEKEKVEEYKKEMNIKKLKLQLRAIRFVMN